MDRPDKKTDMAKIPSVQDDRWFLAAIPLYFLYMYYPIIGLTYVPAPVDLALYHSPWSSLIPSGWPGGSYVLSDIMDQVFPPLKMFRDSILSGDIPLFTDKVQNGVPWLLVSRHELLNPLVFLPVLAFGPIAGYSVAIILKFFLGATFFVVLCRSWSLSYLASTIGAIVFVANAFPVQNFGHGIGAMYYLIPVAMYGIQSILRGSWLWAAISPIVFFSIFASGYPPAVAFHATLYGAFALYQMAVKSEFRLRHIIPLSFTAVSTLLLVFPMLAETYQYLMRDLDFSYRVNYWARHLPDISIASLFMPWGFEEKGLKWTWVRDAIYFGILPIMLVLSGLWLPKGKAPYRFFAVFAIYLLLVLFSDQFLAKFYRYIPVLNGTNPNNQTMIFAFVIAALVSLSWDKVEQCGIPKKRLYLALILGFATLGALVAYWHHIFSLANWTSITSALVALLASGVLIAFWIKGSRKTLCKFLIVSFVAADLATMGHGFNRTVPKKLVYPMTPGIQYIQENLADGKILSLETSMLADVPVWYSIRTFGGRGFFTKETKELYRIINQSAFADAPTQFLFPADDSTKLLSSLVDVLNIRYITANPNFSVGTGLEWMESFKDASGKAKFRLVHSGDMAIFENRLAVGKAFLVGRVAFDSKDSIYANMKAETRDLRDFAWVDESYIEPEDRLRLLQGEKLPLQGTVTNVDLRNSSQRFEVSSSRPALLVVGDSYHPDWKVTINGQPRTLLKVDFSLRGVVVPAGKSIIEFKYDPARLRYGIPIAIATLIMLLGTTCVSLRRRKSHSRQEH